MEKIPAALNGASIVLVRSDKRRHTVSMTVRHPGQVIICAPRHTPQNFIARFIRKRERWILRQVCRHRESLTYMSELKKTGSVPFLGRARPHGLDGPVDPNAVERWYRRQAGTYLEERVRTLCGGMTFDAPRIKITAARRRWGSCSAKNTLCFPWRLMMLPADVVDYIVAHELAHVKEKNHGPAFWRTVASICPSHAAHREWLKDNQHLYQADHEQAQA